MQCLLSATVGSALHMLTYTSYQLCAVRTMNISCFYTWKKLRHRVQGHTANGRAVLTAFVSCSEEVFSVS